MMKYNKVPELHMACSGEHISEVLMTGGTV